MFLCNIPQFCSQLPTVLFIASHSSFRSITVFYVQHPTVLFTTSHSSLHSISQLCSQHPTVLFTASHSSFHSFPVIFTASHGSFHSISVLFTASQFVFFTTAHSSVAELAARFSTAGGRDTWIPSVHYNVIKGSPHVRGDRAGLGRTKNPAMILAAVGVRRGVGQGGGETADSGPVTLGPLVVTKYELPWRT